MKMKSWKVDNLTIKASETRSEMAHIAAKDFAVTVKELLTRKDYITVVFAAAPSQNEFLQAITADRDIDFSRIEAFHMDEYIGLPADSPQTFGYFLRKALFDKRQFKAVHYIGSTAADAQAVADAYGKLISEREIDIVCMGIGENGHIAFNDPPVADFSDPYPMKIVALDSVCRSQQVHDGCFPNLESVPTHALTLTIPTLARASHHFCVVPAATKAQAVYDTLHAPIGTACPATIMRGWVRPILYLDSDSARLLRA
jgi:glucosamine-6-phosphate deaminase